MKQLIVSYNRGDTGGSSFYRLVQVGNDLTAKKLIGVHDNRTGVHPLADICVWQRTCFEEARQVLLSMKNTTHVFDIDDWMFNLPPYMAETHKHFDKAMFRDTVRFMWECDWITTSTKKLADYMSKYTGIDRKKFVVFPNYIDLRKLTRGTTSFGKKVVIAWSNSANRHNYDFAVAEKAILRLMKEYKNLHLVFFGYVPKALYKYKDRISHFPFMPIDKYYEALKKTPIDIWIAPAKKIKFNHCRSSLKLCEGGALGLPVVASGIWPYKDFVEKMGDDTVLIDNWYKNLKLLIDSQAERQTRGAKLNAYVEQKYSLNEGALKHYNWFKKIKKSPVEVKPRKEGVTIITIAKKHMNKNLIQDLTQRTGDGIEMKLLLPKGPINKGKWLNKAIKGAKNDIVIVMESNVKFIDEKWLDKITNALEQYDFVGVSGSSYYNMRSFVWYNRDRNLDAGCVMFPSDDGGFAYTNYGTEKEVVTTSKILLAGKKKAFEDVEFLPYYENFLWMTDFCVRAHQRGYRLGVVPIHVFYNDKSTYVYPQVKQEQQFFFEQNQWRMNWSAQEDVSMNFNLYLEPKDLWMFHETVSSLAEQSIWADNVYMAPNTSKIFTEMFDLKKAEDIFFPLVYIPGKPVFSASAMQRLNNLVRIYDAVTFPMIQMRKGAHSCVQSPYNVYYTLLKKPKDQCDFNKLCVLTEPLGHSYFN